MKIPRIRAPRFTKGAKTIWIVAGVAVVSLVVGLGLGRLITSPAQAAADAEPPPAGPITVPVERRELNNDVTLRADARYEDSSEVRVSTGDISGGTPVVTGQVPEVGAIVDAGAVLLEITDRPVILLPGELPVYRTMRAGVSGADVLQLKQALASLGIDPGDVNSELYDAATAAAVAQLFTRSGYAPPTTEGASEAVRAAQDQVRAAQVQVSEAASALAQAQQGPTELDKFNADLAIRQAEVALKLAKSNPTSALEVRELEVALRAARAERAEMDAEPDTRAERTALRQAEIALEQAIDAAAGDIADDGEGTLDLDSLLLQVEAAQLAVEEARDALREAEAGPSEDEKTVADIAVRNAERTLAEAQATGTEDEITLAEIELRQANADRESLLNPDVSSQRTALTSAQASLADAKSALAEAQSEALTPLSAGEVIFLPQLPRRVDAVNVQRGDTVSASTGVMSLSGATLELVATASASDAELLAVGDTATVELDGQALPVTVASIERQEADASQQSGARYEIIFQPGEITEEQREALRGSNVRVTIPVSSTEGEVLAVPLAALSAGAGGEARVEVLLDAETEETELVTVTTGLAAGGYVEVTAVDGTLTEGDLVVVGR